MNTQLLRPFDREAVVKGAPICSSSGVPLKYIYGPDKHDRIFILKDLNEVDWLTARWIKMRPLGWCEGKPVYPGDQLYSLDTTVELPLDENDPYAGFTWTAPQCQLI